MIATWRGEIFKLCDMRGWLRHLELTAKSKTGLSARVYVMVFVAVLCAAVTVGFFIDAIFVWLWGYLAKWHIAA